MVQISPFPFYAIDALLSYLLLEDGSSGGEHSGSSSHWQRNEEREGIISNGRTSALRVSKGDTSVDPAGSSLCDLGPRKPRQMQSFFQKMEHIGLTCV